MLKVTVICASVDSHLKQFPTVTEEFIGSILIGHNCDTTCIFKFHNLTTFTLD
nr:MAG TPA: hypothetical protein [Caudoviricetes sp.]